MPSVISFQQAIADSEHLGKRHLLLGNGFSIACKPDIFHYGSLFDQADFSRMPEAKAVFASLNTQDFELAIRALQNGSALLPIYAPEAQKKAILMKQHSEALKEALISTIAGNHPEGPHDLNEAKIWACRTFLSHFIKEDSNKSGYVFTLNYDLLLYWVLMNEGNPFEHEIDRFHLKRNDGFGNDEDDPGADYVVWQGETAAHSANVYYLHGALHLFDSGAELQKYTWVRSGERLVEQVRTALTQNKFPLFVAEGSSDQKKNRIRHNAYLYQGLKVFTQNAQTKNHGFFIFGHSLAANDDHILLRLARGKFSKLYIGLYGDPSSEGNKSIIAKAHGIAVQRHEKYPLTVVFFDSATANVWGY